MKTNFSILVLLLFSSNTFAQDSSNITDRGAAAQNLLVTPERLVHLCEGQTGAYWCDGFFSAMLASLGISPTAECLPPVDVNNFIHEGAWSLTKKWLSEQPTDLKITRYVAVINGLTEEGSCNIEFAHNNSKNYAPVPH